MILSKDTRGGVMSHVNPVSVLIVILAHYFLPGNALIMLLLGGRIVEDRIINAFTVILLSIIVSIAINAIMALALGNPIIASYDIRITTPALIVVSVLMYIGYIIRVKVLWRSK